VNWYRLEAVRETLRADYGAALAPSAIGRPNLEVWQRIVGEHTYIAFVRYEGGEFLVQEASLQLAAEALRLGAAAAFLDRVKARGGLWTGPSPAG
jgi:hypothetical protein